MRKWLTGIVLIVLVLTASREAVAGVGGAFRAAQPAEAASLTPLAPGLDVEGAWWVADQDIGGAASTGQSNRQVPPASRLSVLAAGPVDLLVTDPQGRRVGVDPVTGQVVQEIPDVFYYGPHETYEGLEIEMITIHAPLTGTYTIRLTGTGQGWFDLTVVIGSSLDDEIILHDLSGILPGQVREYTVGGERQPLAERAIAYALPALREVGEWNSALRLQNPTGVSVRTMVTLYNGWGNSEVFASNERTVAAYGTLPITLAGELSLPAGFWGVATVENRDGGKIPLALTATTTDGRHMATAGIAQGAATLYVPYLPNDDLVGVLYALNASDENSTVRVSCYDLAGALVPSASVTLTVAPRATLRSTPYSGLPAGFQGSAVLESLNGQPLVGAVFLGDPAGRAALYSVADRPAAALFVPQVLKGSAGLTTTLHLQNTAAATTTVVIRYYDAAGQALAAAETRLTLAPHGAAQVVVGENSALPAGFAGAAAIQSLDGAPLTAVALVHGGPGNDTLAATSVPYGGSPTLALPYLDTSGQTPAVQVQNLGSAATTVTLRCYDPAGTPAYTATAAIAPYGYAAFVTATLPLTSGIYAAVLESGNEQPLAAFVRQQGLTEGLSLYGGAAAGPFVVPPVSSAAAPAAARAPFTVTVTTNAPPAEIVSTTLWVRPPLTTTWSSTGLTFTGTSGALVYTPTAGDGAYHFAAVAVDAAGYREAAPAGSGDSATLYDTIPPTSAAAAPAYANGAAITVTFVASDTGSGVAYTELWVRPPPTTTWDASGLVLTGTSGVFVYTPTAGDGAYYFATRAQDNAGNREAAPTGAGDDRTVYDTTPPSSAVEPLPAYSLAVFTVTWSGSDATSGLLNYDVQVCTVDCISGWSDWLTQTTTTTHAFSGSHGVTYSFRARARDVAGNVADWPASADTATTVDTAPPETAVDAMPPYYTTTTFPVSWQGADALSGLHHYDLYYATESAADWSLWLAGLTTTQALFTGTRGYTYHFCSQGVDNLGNTEHCLPSCIDGPPCWPIQSDAHTGVTPWSRVNDLPAETSGNTIHVTWSGAPGMQVVYDVQVRDGLYGMWLPWKSGVTYTAADFVGQQGHIYCFRSRQRAGGTWELYPLNYDTCTKLIDLDLGGPVPPGAPLTIPPDEAPDRMEEVTRTQALGTLTGYIAPAGDVDWYRFALTQTTRLRVTLADLGLREADFDAYVFDGRGRFLWASTWGRQLPEEIVVRVPAGVYYVQLVGYAGAWSGELPYRLAVEVAEGGGAGAGGLLAARVARFPMRLRQ